MKHPDLDEIERDLAETLLISNSYMNHKLRIFSLRWLVIILLYTLLWSKFAWIKWTLTIILPYGFLNLWQILSIRSKLNKKVEDIKHTIDNIPRK